MTISPSTERHADFPDSGEWNGFRTRVIDYRKAVERMLRRELVHDSRAGLVRLQNVDVRDIADEALCRVLDDWRSKPAGTTPLQWMFKHAMHELDETLDREALAAEARAEERAEERKLLAHDLIQDDVERVRWFEMAEMAHALPADSDPQPPAAAAAAPADDNAHQFDGLTSSREIAPDASADQAEMLRALEHAMLRLSETPRRALAMRYLDGLDVEDIAYLLDLPEAKVEEAVADGLLSLRRQLRVAG